ncbi:uncharacterized protein BX664DRAFT_323789 [Halteromyces radiatus]|uniref:uncharacterized protein n=1 Tax=Halteromyces radiatus TaxID=101107 RepID=UPI002220BC6C|nr:uncharacterized protein BX664DRAFT_323789 [Halteromyces radiatus]KAI8096356.1 hypothetical protein BX664DRAFT_323789 [Halteromyces radiatus]
MYQFSFINPFFDAFLKGIRSLPSWDEIHIALDHLCVIQVFEDLHTKEPLLAVLIDFRHRSRTNCDIASQNDPLDLMLLARPPSSMVNN